MKIACSSASFAREIENGELTLFEWVDLCANELEVDGIVFDTAQLVRTDPEFIAQMKKGATDLGLTIAAVECSTSGGGVPGDAELVTASALGAPILMVRAPLVSADPEAWGRFCDGQKALAGAAKALNVTLALRPVDGTLCGTAADLPRVAKDVDSSWLRFAADGAQAPAAETLLRKSVIATFAIGDASTFATGTDPHARDAIAHLCRFRGFVVLERATGERDAYHFALERFAAQRANALSKERVSQN